MRRLGHSGLDGVGQPVFQCLAQVSFATATGKRFLTTCMEIVLPPARDPVAALSIALLQLAPATPRCRQKWPILRRDHGGREVGDMRFGGTQRWLMVVPASRWPQHQRRSRRVHPAVEDQQRHDQGAITTRSVMAAGDETEVAPFDPWPCTGGSGTGHRPAGCTAGIASAWRATAKWAGGSGKRARAGA